jgi:hypothetical protein
LIKKENKKVERKPILTALLIVFMVTSMSILTLTIRGEAEVDAGPDQTSYVDQEVTFSGSVSLDNASIISITWDFDDGSTPVNGSNPALLNTTAHIFQTAAVYNVTLTVKLNSVYNLTETDTVTVTVVQNEPPVADAGPDQIVEATSPEGAEVVLDASGSYDPYDDPLTYNWTWTDGSATGVNATALFPLGTTNVTLTVNDGQYNATAIVSITVVDTTPPEITIVATPDDLWPPNHKYVEVTTVVTAQDLSDPSPNITFVSITSNEPDNAKGIGDGNTVDDIVIVDDFTFKLRAERAGNGSGRIYTITYEAIDASGNTAQAYATVTVKHNR